MLAVHRQRGLCGDEHTLQIHSGVAKHLAEDLRGDLAASPLRGDLGKDLVTDGEGLGGEAPVKDVLAAAAQQPFLWVTRMRACTMAAPCAQGYRSQAVCLRQRRARAGEGRVGWKK
eukprot:COSAG01_NODE_33_length_35013_cov_86.824144_15_plen_116_part_00